jgi:hypothetical protein
MASAFARQWMSTLVPRGRHVSLAENGSTNSRRLGVCRMDAAGVTPITILSRLWAVPSARTVQRACLTAIATAGRVLEGHGASARLQPLAENASVLMTATPSERTGNSPVPPPSMQTVIHVFWRAGSSLRDRIAKDGRMIVSASR